MYHSKRRSRRWELWDNERHQTICSALQALQATIIVSSHQFEPRTNFESGTIASIHSEQKGVGSIPYFLKAGGRCVQAVVPRAVLAGKAWVAQFNWRILSVSHEHCATSVAHGIQISQGNQKMVKNEFDFTTWLFSVVLMGPVYFCNCINCNCTATVLRNPRIKSVMLPNSNGSSYTFSTVSILPSGDEVHVQIIC